MPIPEETPPPQEKKSKKSKINIEDEEDEYCYDDQEYDFSRKCEDSLLKKAMMRTPTIQHPVYPQEDITCRVAITSSPSKEIKLNLV